MTLYGLMQDEPLLISKFLIYAETYHPAREIVSRDPEGRMHRTCYEEAAVRAKRLARALMAFGIKPGDRVATLAMNHYRHFELFYGVSGLGAVLHTVNPRLFEDQIAYICNHAEDRILLFDPAFLPPVSALTPRLETIEKYVVLAGLEALDEEGWLPTGDVATLDAQGYLHITDRLKDVIKSGGEWISSVEIENLAYDHPDVKLAAVVAVHHPKWEERPLLVIAPNEGAVPTKQSILDCIRPHVAKWWLPDYVVFVQDMPMTATGKIKKIALREQFKDYVLPGSSGAPVLAGA